MASEQDRLEFSRLTSATTPPVRIVEFPRLAEALAPLLPRAGDALRDLDAKIDEWRKSISFGPESSTTVVNQAGTPAELAPAQATIPLFFDRAPAEPDDPTAIAASIDSGTGVARWWNPQTKTWIP